MPRLLKANVRWSSQLCRAMSIASPIIHVKKVRIILGSRLLTCEAELQQGANEYQMFPVCTGNESRATLALGVARRRSSCRLQGKSHEGANRIVIGRACGVVCLGQSNK
jgi:hypothetical protein